MAFELGTIPRWAFADKTGRWLVGGKLNFYRSEAKDQKKTVYQDSNGVIPHDNPITLDALGSVGPIYFEDDEPYYITLNEPSPTNPDGILPPVWEFDNYVPTTAGGGGTPGGTEIDYTNFVMNGQFRFFSGNPFTSLISGEIEIAPYWFFNKSNATATDTIEFLPFLTGVTDPPFSPTYYCRYNCTNVPTGETYKDFYIKIKDVNAFQNQFLTMSIEQRGNNPAQVFEFRYLQHFGTGGSPSADVVGAIASHNISATWDKTSSTTTLPTIGGKVLGTNKDDYLALIIRLPLNAVTQFDFTNGQVNIGDKILDYEYQTYDKAKNEEISINQPIYRDIRGLYTEQNVSDITKLITIGEGYCSDFANNGIFRLRQAITKDISLPWAEGDLNGGLPSSLTLTADTWYHIFLIFRPNGGVDAGFDTDITAANLLADPNVINAGYLFYRRVWSFRTDSTPILKDYYQKYETNYWKVPTNVNSDAVVSTIFNFEQTYFLDVPPDIPAEAMVNFTGYVETILHIFDKFVGYISILEIPYIDPSADHDTAPGAMIGSGITINSPFNTYNETYAVYGGPLLLHTSSSRSIRAILKVKSLFTANYHFYMGVNTLGWKDRRID